ncbi:unnamed protein product [Mytilus coruscus]|uniref:Uncharacterized protein n=1 Tax=Mytilus coruscus TaxID=42192 RepID=A0A6J8DHM8_MYTCO|nr:unnamed protein product [Mytilus coruscus]
MRKNDRTPLHVAENKRVADILIQNGAIVSSRDGNGMTPLHLAARCGNFFVADVLISKKADVNATDSNNETPLHLAANQGHQPVMIRLINAKANVNANNNKNQTPLHLAAKCWDETVLCLLTDNNANVNVVDNKGNNPLHLVQSKKAAETLLELGLRINSTNIKGDTPLHRAVINSKLIMVRSLHHLGANILAKNNKGLTPYDIVKVAYGKNPTRYLSCLEYLKIEIENIGSTNDQSNVTSNTEDASSRELIETNTEQSGETKEKEIQLPWLVDADDFQRMLSHGEYLSYENRLSLGGPCRAGKSTLASVLIDEEIPLKWNSTDGLVIFFGRNGIDIKQNTMVPLKKGERGHEVFAKILRGEPDVLKTSEKGPREQTPIITNTIQTSHTDIAETESSAENTQRR